MVPNDIKCVFFFANAGWGVQNAVTFLFFRVTCSDSQELLTRSEIFISGGNRITMSRYGVTDATTRNHFINHTQLKPLRIVLSLYHGVSTTRYTVFILFWLFLAGIFTHTVPSRVSPAQGFPPEMNVSDLISNPCEFEHVTLKNKKLQHCELHNQRWQNKTHIWYH